MSELRAWIALGVQIAVLIAAVVWAVGQINATTNTLQASIVLLNRSVEELDDTITEVQRNQNDLRERVSRIEGSRGN